MGTDVSSFKDAYKTAITGSFPDTIALRVGKDKQVFERLPIDLRYGTNPHQPFMAYAPTRNVVPAFSFAEMDMLKGGKAGLSLTNLQDMSQALNVLKYFKNPAVVAMKHLNPCGFKVRTERAESYDEIYRQARKGDERSHFGSVVGFNRTVDVATAEEIMKTFVEAVIAPDYTEKALEILRKNEGTKKLNNSIRVAKISGIENIPKFIGDSVNGLYNIRNLADGTLTLEIPYLTRIRGVQDLIFDPMIPNSDPAKNNGQDYVVKTMPTERQLDDALTAWWLNINVRSNGIIFVRDGMALAVGTGQQERVGAVEQAIAKAKQKGHSLEGSVMSSDAFFPNRDSIDAIGKEGVKAVVWPAGSMADAQVIEAANQYNIALMATLERCFLHI